MIQDSRAVDPLLAAINDAEADVREQVVWALGMIQDQRALDGLTQALKDEDPDVREQALWAIGMMAHGSDEE
jgi:HEAT repeat protein